MKRIWGHMRCMQQTNQVYIWSTFKDFEKDISKIKGYELWKDNPDKYYITKKKGSELSFENLYFREIEKRNSEPILMFKDGKLHKEFFAAREAIKELGITWNNLYASCMGHKKEKPTGVFFRFKNREIDKEAEYAKHKEYMQAYSKKKKQQRMGRWLV